MAGWVQLQLRGSSTHNKPKRRILKRSRKEKSTTPIFKEEDYIDIMSESNLFQQQQQIESVNINIGTSAINDNMDEDDVDEQGI